MVRGGNSSSFPPRTNELTYRPLALRKAQWRQSALPPVPERRYLRSMLFPSVQAVLLWYTSWRTECHVLVVRGIVCPFCPRGANEAPVQLDLLGILTMNTMGAEQGRGELNPQTRRLESGAWPTNAPIATSIAIEVAGGPLMGYPNKQTPRFSGDFLGF
jgi:hypothetical protein